MLTEKEKFEEELKLLEESYTLDVITKDEYGDAKRRIESKLKRLEQKEGLKVEEYYVAPKKEAKGIGTAEEGEEANKEVKKEIAEEHEEEIISGKKEIAHETYSNEIIDEGVDEEKNSEEIYVRKEEKEKEEEISDISQKWEDPKEEAESNAKKAKQPKFRLEELAKVPEPEEEKNPESILGEEIHGNKKIYVYAAIVLILVAMLSYFFFFPRQDNPNAAVDKFPDNPISLIACNSDKECNKESAVGTCKNPGKENSECSYIEDAKVRLTVLNANKCFNCETGRVLTILTGFFPNLDIENMDFETEEGKKIAERFSVSALPAYVLNSSLKEAYNYDKFSSAFNEINEHYVMKNKVSNANYYIGRNELPNKLDIFIKSGQPASSKAEENLKEFLKAFDGKVIFERHNEDSKIVEDIGINTFPSFLVNNKIRFSGVQPASKIKENFCEMNNLPECSLELSKNLI